MTGVIAGVPEAPLHSTSPSCPELDLERKPRLDSPANSHCELRAPMPSLILLLPRHEEPSGLGAWSLLRQHCGEGHTEGAKPELETLKITLPPPPLFPTPVSEGMSVGVT